MDAWDYRWNWFALLYAIRNPEERMSNIMIRYELIDWKERVDFRDKPWEE